MSVLVVGAGFTSSVLCKTLRSTSPELILTVWEKSRGAGGRQATKRHGEHSCDIGAQYLTHWKTDTFFEPYIKILRSTQVIRKFEGKIVNSPLKYGGGECTHYIAPKGMNSLAKYFNSGTNTHFSNKVTSIRINGDSVIVGNADKRSAAFDAVVLTIPAPQLLDIEIEPPLIDKVKNKISNVQFTPRFTLMLVFDETPEFDWVIKYHDDDIVRCLVWDHIKRQKGLNPTLLLHSSAKYSVQNTDVKSKEEAGEEMLAQLQKLYPELPKPIKVIPHFWRYGQVYKPYEGTPGYIVLNEKPLIIAGGDSFMRSSNLSMCAKAAELLADKLKDFSGLPKFDFDADLTDKTLFHSR